MQTNLHGQRVITGKSHLNSSNCKHHIFTQTSDVSEEFMSFPARLTTSFIHHACFLPAIGGIPSERWTFMLKPCHRHIQKPICTVCFSLRFITNFFCWPLFQIVQVLKGLVLWIWRDSTSSKQEDRKCYWRARSLIVNKLLGGRQFPKAKSVPGNGNAWAPRPRADWTSWGRT